MLVSQTVIQNLSVFQRIWVGFSGGLDSTVLLHQLTQISTLQPRLIAIHVHHGLQVDADVWSKHCETFCHHSHIPLYIEHVACQRGSHQESLARKARYCVFDAYVQDQEVLLLGHHQQDQAETCLLHLCRGSGIDGLCAMWAVRIRKHYTIMRPLLTVPRLTLQRYAATHRLSWVEDDSNLDRRFNRNYLRHEILPLLQHRWSKVVQHLCDATQYVQSAQRNLYDLACCDCPTLKDPVLSLSPLRQLPEHRLTNVVWFWLKHQQVSPLNQAIVKQVMHLILHPQRSGKRVIFHHQQVWYYQDMLYLEIVMEAIHHFKATWIHFPKPFLLPATLGVLHAQKKKGHIQLPPHTPIDVRFRTGGECIRWHGQTKCLKKLFQDLHILPWQRHHIPLLYVGGTLAVIVGYAVSDIFYTHEKGWEIQWIQQPLPTKSNLL